MLKNLLTCVAFCTCIQVCAQRSLSLTDLSDFKPQAGNWQIVGDVTMNRSADIHATPAVEKKSKKKKKAEPAPILPVTFESGSGILLNMNDDTKKDNLITTWEHGDIELEFDVMLPKGSNSGVFLQGRYEIQLFDSWGVQQPKYSDMGGIYKNWETDPEKMLIGIPPQTNACKAPGLWQHMKISFKAPRFDAAGKKIQNARFELVELNGSVIHRNVEVARVGGGPIENNEVSKGPLMIQGDHGAVAFRKFQYTLLEDSKVELSNLSYQTFEGEFKNIADLKDQENTGAGASKLIDVTIASSDDRYGLVFNGTLEIPQDDTYELQVGYTGGFRLEIDGKTVSEYNASDSRGVHPSMVELTKGSHDFRLTNIKSAPWHPRLLGLFVKSASTDRKPLHLYDSYPDISGVRPEILLDPKDQPRLHRGFVRFAGNGPKLSHTIGVGHPAGVNYAYNLKTGGLIGMWRGQFADATPMWHNRGDGSFRTNGSTLWTFLDQPIAKLSSESAAFPKFDAELSPRQLGYRLGADKMPTFINEIDGVKVETTITPDASGKYLIEQLKFDQTALSSWYLKIAEGNAKLMSDGSYAIGDQSYYVKVISGQQPKIREVNGQQELVLPIDGSDVKFEIIW